MTRGSSFRTSAFCLLPSYLSSTLYRGPRLALGFPSADRLPFVAHVLSFRERDRQLDAAVLEIQPQRHDRESLNRRLAEQLVELFAVQEELSLPRRIVRRRSDRKSTRLNSSHVSE